MTKKTFSLHRTLARALALLPVLGCVQAAPPAAAAADTRPAYQAYYDIMQERMKALGTVKPSSVVAYDGMAAPKAGGLYFARVLDMDSDGYPELFLVESRPDAQDEIDKALGLQRYTLYPVLYTYRNGRVSKVLDIDFGLAPGGWSFCKAADGLTYFKINGPESHDTFYSVKGGKLIKQEFNILWSYDYSVSGTVNGQHVWAHTSTAHASGYYINNKSVSSGEYSRTLKNMERSVSEAYNFYSNKSSDTAVNETLQFVINHTPGTFLQCYTTPSGWAQASVTEAIGMGVVPKRLQKMYNQPITREEFCELAANYYEKSTGTTITALADFSDTKSAAVRKMGGLGIISGTGGGKFSPDASLTREQAAVILVKLAEKLGTALPESAPDFTDRGSISSWASAQVGKAQAAGIMSGTGGGNFSPKTSYTREQSISTMLRLNSAQPEVTLVKTDKDALTLLSGGSAVLKATAYDGAKEIGQVFTWTSSNPSVASVDPYSGKVTAKSAGTASIRAAAANGVSGSCTVTVPQLNDKFYAELPVEQQITVRSSFNETGKALFRINSIESGSYGAVYVNLTLLEMPEDTLYTYLVLNGYAYDANGKLLDNATKEDFILEYDPGDTFTVSLHFFKLKTDGPFWVKFS